MVEIIKKERPFEYQMKTVMLSGVIWGGLELLLTPAIKSLSPPLSAALAPAMIIVFVLAVKSYLPAPGTVLMMGIIAATMKFLLGGALIRDAFLAILLQAAIIEVVFLLAGFRARAYFLSAILAGVYTLIHPLISLGYFFKSQQFILFKRWLAGLLGYDYSWDMSEPIVATVMAVIHIVLGILAGWLAVKVVRYLFRREKSPPGEVNHAGAK